MRKGALKSENQIERGNFYNFAFKSQNFAQVVENFAQAWVGVSAAFRHSAGVYWVFTQNIGPAARAIQQINSSNMAQPERTKFLELALGFSSGSGNTLPYFPPPVIIEIQYLFSCMN